MNIGDFNLDMKPGCSWFAKQNLLFFFTSFSFSLTPEVDHLKKVLKLHLEEHFILFLFLLISVVKFIFTFPFFYSLTFLIANVFRCLKLKVYRRATEGSEN